MDFFVVCIFCKSSKTILTYCQDGTSSTVSRSWDTQLLKYGSDSQHGEEVSLLQSTQTGS